MAVFGFQCVLTLILLSLISKFRIRYSFARWLLTKGGLVRYLHPSNERLKEAIAQNGSAASGDATGNNANNNHKSNKNLNKSSGSTRRRKLGQPLHLGSETFNVPKSLQLALEAEPLNIYNLATLPYYDEFEFLIDFCLCAVGVYFSTETYYLWNPSKIGTELNLSLIWCLLSLFFIVKVLCKITWTYFRGGDQSIGERSMCIVSGCIFFLISMIILIVDEELLEFGLIDSYKSFSSNAHQLLELHGKLDVSPGPSSFLMIKFWLAIWCSLVAIFFTFPGIRIARMHKDALFYCSGSPLTRYLLNTSFILPLFILLFWVKPIARYYLTVREFPNRGILMSSQTFDSLRFVFILVVIGLRFTLFRQYIQSYLNIAPQKLHFLKKEAGRITNIDYQKTIARVHHYMCVAALQFMAPLLMCLFITLLAKSSGSEYRWSFGVFTDSQANQSSLSTLVPPQSSESMCELRNSTLEQFNQTLTEMTNSTVLESNPAMCALDNPTTSSEESVQGGTVEQSFQNEVDLTISLFHVFNSTVLKGLTSFLLWWTVGVWFATSAMGFIYHTYFENNQ